MSSWIVFVFGKKPNFFVGKKRKEIQENAKWVCQKRKGQEDVHK